MTVKIWCGGSDTPFIFKATRKEFDDISRQLASRCDFSMVSYDRDKEVLVRFNASRVDAIQLTEE